MFRVNFFIFWVIINGVYIFFLGSSVNQNTITVNDGTWGFLEGFSTYLACVVLYKVIFAALHLLRFRFRIYCYNDMRTQNLDLGKEYQRLKEEGKARGKGRINREDKVSKYDEKSKSAMTQE